MPPSLDSLDSWEASVRQPGESTNVDFTPLSIDAQAILSYSSEKVTSFADDAGLISNAELVVDTQHADYTSTGFETKITVGQNLENYDSAEYEFTIVL